MKEPTSKQKKVILWILLSLLLIGVLIFSIFYLTGNFYVSTEELYDTIKGKMETILSWIAIYGGITLLVVKIVTTILFTIRKWKTIPKVTPLALNVPKTPLNEKKEVEYEKGVNMIFLKDILVDKVSNSFEIYFDKDKVLVKFNPKDFHNEEEFIVKLRSSFLEFCETARVNNAKLIEKNRNK